MPRYGGVPFLLLCLATIALLALIEAGCFSDSDRLFVGRSPERTGVQFQNTITEDDSLMNPVDYLYIYNGGGVGLGDFNGNGRPDLYFAGNMVENRLYLNEGNFQFRDVTDRAGVAAADVWSTGVTVADVNQDGRLDVYVCIGGPSSAGADRANRLYINQGVGPNGVPTFSEEAERYGVADTSYSTHAAFFDYDRDGDLDLYVLNNAMQSGSQNALTSKQTEGQAKNTDRLYRNNGDGSFTDVSAEAGIQIEGHGLGLAISDINKDGWPDVYVANDFASNDLLYVNNGDGTFTNRIGEYTKHQSYSAMGVDVADVNNDAHDDIMVLDMLPPDHLRQKMMPYPTNYELLQRGDRRGYELQYLQNTLQLNTGTPPDGGLFFSEIARLAGVAATDWSWAPLLADFDNDGERDLFVTNGYGEDVTNFDFAQKQRRLLSFGTSEAQRDDLIEAMKNLPTVDLPNRFFENEGTLRFADRTGTWASRKPGISNGAAFGDLDGDGDLDLVTNNINEPATILENTASSRDSAHALHVRLHGPSDNRRGLGAKLTLHNRGVTMYQDFSPYRGYQSTVGSTVHFGLGADTTADSLSVVWPDGRAQTLTDLSVREDVTVHYDSAASDKEASSAPDTVDSAPLFEEVTRARGLGYRHREASVNEFEQHPLLPHQFSREGPGVAVGDVDGDGRDDLYVGSDRGHHPLLFRQTDSGRFRRDTLQIGQQFEDRGALFFDADGDGTLDLYVVSGGSAQSTDSSLYQDRLYLNDGTGKFRRADRALPEISTPGSVVTAADFNGDGDLDLFVGGRVRPGAYPRPPRSVLLRNDAENGTAKFTDVTEKVAPGLEEVGLVTDALWTDYDNDGDRDLMVAGEWMPITVYQNDEGRLTEVTDEVGLSNTSGWWTSLAAGDFDRDGDTDYLAGNLGLNTRFEAAPDQPVQVHAKDYDENGTLDPILSLYFPDGNRYPVPERDELLEQIPGLKARIPTYRSYAEKTFEEIFSDSEREGAYVREAVRFRSSYLENEGDGEFVVRSLPRRVQVAPIFGMQTGDYDRDGTLDVLMVGNWYATNSKTGRADAFPGAFLDGNGTGQFAYRNHTETGFFVEGDGKGLAEIIDEEGGSLLVATQSGGHLKAFQSPDSRLRRRVVIHPGDRYAKLVFPDGSNRKEEFFYGSTYLSQSSRFLRVPDEVIQVVIYDTEGDTRRVLD